MEPVQNQGSSFGLQVEEADLQQRLSQFMHHLAQSGPRLRFLDSLQSGPPAAPRLGSSLLNRKICQDAAALRLRRRTGAPKQFARKCPRTLTASNRPLAPWGGGAVPTWTGSTFMSPPTDWHSPGFSHQPNTFGVAIPPARMADHGI